LRIDARLTFIAKAFFAAVIGLAVGLWSAEMTVRSFRGFGAVAIGPWKASVEAGSPDTDPYSRAFLERSGEIPLGLAEGLQFVANVDSDGARLDARCTYRLGAKAPPARRWTLSLVNRRGFPVANPAERYGFRSTEIVREPGGAFTILVSPHVQSGNWLPVGLPERFALVLRLYDSPVSATAATIEPASMPRIVREGCG